jgi:hypothetical protein
MAVRPRVALCFFGLVKNYALTAPSVEQFILAPLRAQGYDYDVYIHTYNQLTTTNPRNAEARLAVRPVSISRSFPGATIRRDAPAMADRVHPLSYYLQGGDPWVDNPGVSMLHYSRQLYSLRQVTALWAPKAHLYTFVVYLRPDVRFTTPLGFNPRLRERQVAVPNFHNFSGCNDRFAYGRPTAMKLYGERLNWLDEFFRRHRCSLHAERYLKFFLLAHDLEPVRIPFHFVRIRADGHENRTDVVVRAEALR